MKRYEVELSDEQARKFEAEWPYDEGFDKDTYSSAAVAIADAIRANPPKPAEPTELGAMVKDRDGGRWLRLRFRTKTWARATDGTFQDWRDYADIDVVEVIR